MAVFHITCVRPEGGRVVLLYDNMNSTLTHEDGTSVVAPEERKFGTVHAVSKETPGVKGGITTLKISLGLSCNYSCGYCNQRFVPHASEAGLEDIEPFLEKLPSWFDVTQPNPRVEFWGGEPLVYWKTLKPLAERLREMMPEVPFLIITNGSLLDAEKNEWLDTMGFNVGLSHDGPGQSVRGPDPLDDPEVARAIHDLWSRLGPKGRMSFNAMMNRKNQSRAAVQAWFMERFGPDVVLGEGGFIDPYDKGGAANSLKPWEHHDYRTKAFHEIRGGQASAFNIAHERIQTFLNSLRFRRPASSLGQKCGMDKPSDVAVTLKGEVLTCQNVSPVSRAMNGRSHKIGTVDKLDKVKLDTATHWSKRTECSNCPVLHICAGACMFLDGRLFEIACDNAFSDTIPFFAASIEYLTGMVPVHIEGPLREDRKWLWGRPG